MELLGCFIVHMFLIFTLRHIAFRINNAKVKKVLIIILLVIVPAVYYEQVLGYKRNKN